MAQAAPCEVGTFNSSGQRTRVPFYAQRLSAASVLNGARSIQKSLKGLMAKRRPASGATAAA